VIGMATVVTVWYMDSSHSSLSSRMLCSQANRLLSLNHTISSVSSSKVHLCKLPLNLIDLAAQILDV